MSLDVTILSRDGRPGWTVSVGVDLHHRLTTAARKLALQQLSRMQDYYKDVTYETGDVPNLILDLEALLQKPTSDRELANLCRSLLDLARRANDEAQALEVIAD